MHLPAKLILPVGVAVAVAITAYPLLTLLGKWPSSAAEPVANELCVVAPATPYDPSSGLAMRAAKRIPADARCPVCGMYPARAPRWATQTVFRDGASHFFDSPVDLFVFLQRINRGRTRYAPADIVASYVTDFESGSWIEAHQAYFAKSASVMGPMRDVDLPAFSTREAAGVFARRWGGEVLTFKQVTPELIKSMNRNTHHQHQG